MTRTFRFRLLDSRTDEIANALTVAGATINVAVPTTLRAGYPLRLPRPAPKVTIEFRWCDPRGRTRPGFVQLRDFRHGPEESPLVRFEVGGTPRVTFLDPLTFGTLCVNEASVTAERGLLNVSELLVEHAQVVDSADLGGLVVAVRGGSIRAARNPAGVRVEQARGTELSRRPTDPCCIVARHVSDSCFDDVLVLLQPGATIEGCRGTIRLVRCAAATIEGRPREPLSIEAVFPATEAHHALTRAVLRNVRFAPQSVRAVIDASEAVSVLDPAPETIVDSLSAVDPEVQTSVAELLHDRINEKARRQETVDAAAVAVLDIRRRNAHRYRTEWALLTAFWLLGYGRSIRRPLLLWLCIVLAMLGLRTREALDTPAGYVRVDHGVHVDWSRRAFAMGGDVVLTTILLPVNWNRSTDSRLEERVGLGGGYLTALRVLMIIPLIAVAGGVRRRVRVRPYSDSR